ncbi:MAG: hypothetical protein HN368_00710, partial [Spirochaetales bacterium]|nr:hypothetical protein [Spirochaetales bacterium]
TPIEVFEKGKVAAYLEYAGSWEKTVENGSASYGLDGAASAYPDQNGSVVNSIIGGFFWDTREQGAVLSGHLFEASVLAAPEFLANSLHGRTDFYLLSAGALGYIPLLTLTQTSGLNLFSIYIADRFLADGVLGTAVPQFSQRPLALGTKMRGFEKNTHGTAFTLVNNFDLRFAGPEILIKNLNPAVTLFLDMGYFGGIYLNTSYKGSGVLASTGFEAAVNLLGIFAVGYRGAFILAGENMAQSTYSGGLMFSFQF